jgi:hypothetical protein
MTDKNTDAFVAEYVKELHAGTAAVFLGAGMSATVGFVDWVTLLQPIAEQLGLDANRESDHLVALAQYHVNDNGLNRSALHKRLLEEFPSHQAPHENHKLLARLPLSEYWTTNYDKLIERGLEDAGKIVDCKWQVDQLAHTKPRRNAVVYKMHGDIEHPSTAVLTKDDYERYPRERGAFVTALSGDLVSRTFLFLGFSFKDPNLDYILSRIRLTFNHNGRQHYCVFRRVSAENGDTAAEVEYKERKQALLIQDLKRFNIKVLLVDSYHEITELLQRIERSYRRKTLFISGSAETFGTWSKSDVSEFLFALGQLVIQRKYRLVSGFGWGLSNDLLSGAIEQIYAQREGHIQDHLVVRPFPRAIVDVAKRDALWHEFRRDLISQAGIALFLFGNKKASDGSAEVVLADGVRKEHEITQQLDLVCLPVGSTGYVAAELGQKMLPAIQASEASDAYKRAFAALQEPAIKPQELLGRIIAMLDAIPNN